jgi:hypothetical protein
VAPTAGGAPDKSPHLRIPAPLDRRARAALLGVSVLVSCALAGCSSSTPGVRLPSSPSTTADPTAAVTKAVLAAWRAAETAFYQAEANPRGLFSPELSATMTDPELSLVKRNLAAQEENGAIGRGPWNLGSPRVVSLGPTENSPTTATVVSCIDDTQILVDEHTGQPASGLNGTPDWAGETSTMVLIQGSWKLSQQSSVANTNRSIACAGIS